MSKKIGLTAIYIFLGLQFLLVEFLDAQDLPNELLEFKNKFEKKVTNFHQEKVFIHLDKSIYMVGESIWMSFYCLDAAFHSPVGISKVGNIELINDQGKSINKIRIQLTNGFGKGQVFVAPDLATGSYTIRGYTNWMKNFDSEFVFQENIILLNPDKIPITQVVNNTSAEIEVEFFPEGGPIVNNIESKIVIKATDITGGGVIVSGIVVDDEGTEKAKFKTTKNGYTSINLTPQKGYIYSALFFQDSVARKIFLPKAKENGLVLTAGKLAKNDYLVKIKSSSDIERKLYLLVHTRGVIQWLKQIDLTRQMDIQFQSNNLTAGISHLILLDENFSPTAERLIFKYPNDEPSIELNQKKNEYTTREKVTLTLSGKDLKPEDSLAQLSISVFRSMESHSLGENIISNLLLTSDLINRIKNPWYYFDPMNQFRFEQMDLLMLTSGWSRFKWKQIAIDQSINFKYPAETNAPLLSGQLLKDSSNAKSPNLQMSFFGNSSNMNSTSINTEGRFHFEVPFNLRNDWVHFFIKDEALKPSQIQLHSPFDLRFDKTTPIQLDYPAETKIYFDELYTNIQLSQVYRDYSFINGQDSIPDLQSHHFYGKPDHLFLLDDYTRFETVQDIFIEFIRKVRIRKDGKRSNFFMVKDHKLLTSSALALIDGIPIRDIDFILNLDPLKIEKIELINDIYHTGGVDFYGIINFITYDDDFANQHIPAYLIQKAYQAIQVPKKFYMPNYAKFNEDLRSIPDYRNTLYWNPDVKINSQDTLDLYFYTSDDAGLYQIEINGITNTGRPFFLNDSFIVKD